MLRATFVVVAGFGLVLAVPHAPPATPLPVLLDRAVADYLEDGGTKVVAEVDARLQRDAEGIRLVVSVSASGHGVEPEPGYAGVHGHNVRTAREILALLTDGELGFVSRRVAGDHERPGNCRVAERTHLPRRRVRDDGRLDLNGRTPAALPARLRFDSGVLGDGTWRSYVMVRGVPRLRVECAVRADTARIRSIESLGEFSGLRRRS